MSQWVNHYITVLWPYPNNNEERERESGRNGNELVSISGSFMSYESYYSLPKCDPTNCLGLLGCHFSLSHPSQTITTPFSGFPTNWIRWLWIWKGVPSLILPFFLEKGMWEWLFYPNTGLLAQITTPLLG